MDPVEGATSAADDNGPSSRDELADAFAHWGAETGEAPAADPASAPAPAPEEAETAPEGTDPATEEGAETPAAPEPEAQEFASLDAYLEASQLDRDGFYSLPVPVKVDGQESQVPLAELVKSYQLSSAASQRLEAVSRERQTLQQQQEQIKTVTMARMQVLDGLMNDLKSVWLTQIPQELWQTDPTRAVQLDAANRHATDWLNTRFQQLSQLQQSQAQATDQSRLQALAAEQEKMHAVRPEWRDPAKASADYKRMGTYARSLGFSDQELSGITDHRHMLILDMAARYAERLAKAPEVKKVVRAAPPMAKPGARRIRDPKVANYQGSVDAAMRSGSRDSLAQAFSALDALG